MSLLKSLTRPFSREKRDFRRALLETIPQGGVCAEVGVWKGTFSRKILDVTKPSKLHLIDPWSFQPQYPDRIYGGKVAEGQDDMEQIYQNVCAEFGDIPEVEIHRGYSDQLLAAFPDGYFDWLYVDGNHYYDFVLSDLTLGWQKLKPGGLMIGDDYDWGKRDGYPVKRAVAEFMRQHEIQTRPKIVHSQFVFSKPHAHEAVEKLKRA
jgi:hypothetical protein